jgi:catechol 2,3-dioxygenase-like lactoylglutathione lyase family enzyme
MSLNRIELLSVPVADQDRAKEFYVDTLGFELVHDNQMGPEQRWVQVRPKGAQTSITLVTWFDSMPPGSLRGLVVETDDLTGDVEALAARGVAIDGGIQDAPWGRYVTLTDPDGNGLVLQATRLSR